MMVRVCDLFELRDVEQPGELVEMEHRVVFAVLTKERHVFAEIHVLEMIRDEAAIAALSNPLPEFGNDFFV